MYHLFLSLEFFYFLFLLFLRYLLVLVTQSLHIARKIFVTFAIFFAKFAGFWKPLLAIFLSKSRILLNWLLLLLLRYLQVIVSQNFLLNYFIGENCEASLLPRSFLDIYISIFFSFSVLYALPRHTI